MKIVIINLPDSHDRRAYMQAQFACLSRENLDFDFTFFPAVHGKKEPNHPLFQHYNEPARLRRKGNKLTLSQLGCFASHYLVWQKCIDENAPFIVLEDDVKLTPHFAHFYAKASQFAANYRFLWLHKNYRKSHYYVINQLYDFSIVKYYKDYVGTLAYLITPEAARLLVDYFQEVIYPVDDQMARCFENGLENFALLPPCVEIEESLESTIQGRNDQVSKLTVLQKIYREYYNTKDNVARFCYHAKYFSKIKQR
ncbi:glycosyltransferase family 25 protein [Pasteurellaceae bacterium TAE3-ERU1]|nr:glycosyltransferase family 25 protein [Pasteurellaceae bacterium TAE3-ERU1]